MILRISSKYAKVGIVKKNMENEDMRDEMNYSNKNINYAIQESDLPSQSIAIIYEHGWYKVVATDEFGEIVYDNGMMTKEMAHDEYYRMVE